MNDKCKRIVTIPLHEYEELRDNNSKEIVGLNNKISLLSEQNAELIKIKYKSIAVVRIFNSYYGRNSSTEYSTLCDYLENIRSSIHYHSDDELKNIINEKIGSEYSGIKKDIETKIKELSNFKSSIFYKIWEIFNKQSNSKTEQK